jgi:diguanylate cyclase (GGDEF)-like protein/PAS domain S-box-containing protein
MALNATTDPELRASEIVAHSNDSLFVFDPEHDRVIEANAKACRLLGYSREELLNVPMSAILPNEMPKLAAFSHRTPQSADGLIDELACLTKEGEVIRSEISASVVGRGQGSRIIASIREIAARKLIEEELAHQAFHDPLTGLANRNLFMDRLKVALTRTERRPSRVAVLFLDLDRFKLINDSYGHEAGDDLLVALAKRIQHVMRPSDTAARLGGDEFAILSEDVDSDADAIAIAKRILQVIEVPFTVSDDEIVLTSSIGIAVSSQPEDLAPELMRNADAAMYRAKGRGKDRYEVFDSGMRSRARARLKGENALRRAVSRGEFRVFFQPEVDLETRRIVAVEALVRWNHPERGVLLPDHFLGLAEETKLIVPLGSWVLEEACLQAQRWRTLSPDMRSLKLAVNVSARQLSQSGLVDDVARILAKTGTAPSSLCLEVTETALMADLESSTKELLVLRELGVSIAIDDLGKGYSSLSFLKQLPIDTIKVDQSFVQGLGRDPADLAIVTSIVTMAKALNLSLVAEGVETAEQANILSSLDCHIAQGFYFARPGPDKAVGELLMRRGRLN